MNSRDWISQTIVKHEKVDSLEPIGDCFIQVHRKTLTEYASLPSIILGIISSKIVNGEDINQLLGYRENFDFVVNIPNDSIWVGDAISLAKRYNLGWGAVRDLFFALNQEDIRGFQNKEYSFVETGLLQHREVSSISRYYDWRF